MENQINIPTETIELPSKGLVYPLSNPLSSGKIEMKYMTAKEEDILTNQNYIQKGTVLDELMKSLIVSKVDYDDLIAGDKNAIMVAARILGYGKNYDFTFDGEDYSIDLSVLDNKELDESLYTKGSNEFLYKFSNTNNTITFKFLTGVDEKKIEKELEGLKKINKNSSPELSTRLKYIITSVNGNRETKDIRFFVDNHLLARDSKELRSYIKQIQPDVNMVFTTNSGEEVAIPINLSFFWPEL
jgi:hypothetical protein